MRRLLFDNPLLTRFVRARLRRSQSGSILLIVLLICFCILWAGYESGQLDSGGIFFTFFAIQAVALHLAGTSQVASSISQANDSGILDFHRISPLSPLVTSVGFILGAPIREYLVALVVMPFTLFCALIGPPGVMGFLTTTLVLLSSTLLFHAVAMTSGLLATRGRTRGAGMAVSFLLIVSTFSSSAVASGIAFPGILTVGPAVFEAMGAGGFQGAVLPTFLGLEMPLWIQSLVYQTPFTIFLMIAIVRRMRSAQSTLYSRTTALAFLVTVNVLNLAGLLGNPRVDASFVCHIMLYSSFALTCMLTMAVTPGQGTYRNCVRRARRQGLHRIPLWSDESSNRSIVIAFASMTVATTEVLRQSMPGAQMPDHYWLMIVTAAMAILHFGFAAQFFHLRFRKRAQTTFIVFLFLFWIMPLPVAGLSEMTFGPGAAEYVGGISPLLGIGRPTAVGVLSSTLLMLIFFALLLNEERSTLRRIDTAELFADDHDDPLDRPADVFAT